MQLQGVRSARETPEAPPKDPRSRIHDLNLPAACGNCHGNLELIKKAKVEMVTPRENVEYGAAPDHSSLHEQCIPGQAVLT